ncbi:MAG: FtsX-like permease family protein [Planctomycetes bacterium]|nr:FtsX-like permease family protein [Planctomycetota bacterium]
MSVLHRKLRRDLWSSGLLLLAVAAMITIGVVCFIAMQSAYFNLRSAMSDYYRQCRMADFWIDLRKAPVAELNDAMRVAGVADWRDRIVFPAMIDLPGRDAPINARVIALPDRSRPAINDIVIRRGTYFTDDRDEEIILSAAFAAKHELEPGDSVPLIINRRRHALRVVGTAIAAEFTYMLDAGALLPDPERFGVVYVKRRFAEDVDDMSGAANQIIGTLTPEGHARAESVLRRLEANLDAFGVLAAIPRRLQASHQFLSNEIVGLRAFATVVPGVFLVTAALVLNVLLGRIARQQRTVVGTLKALGCPNRIVLRHFLAYGAAVGIAGGVAGSALGYLAALGMTQVYRQFFEFPSLGARYYPGTHAIGITVSIACALLGSLRAARAMVGLRPAEAMRPEPPGRGGTVALERIPWLWRRLGTSSRMAVRNVLRGRWRTAVTVFSSLAGAALLANGFMFLEAHHFLLDFQFEKVLRGDLDVTFTSERGVGALDELRRVPGVLRVEPQLDLPCSLVHGNARRLMAVTGLVPGSELLTPRDADGNPLAIPESGLIVNRELARRLRVEPGQPIAIHPVRGDREPRLAVVGGLADSFMGMAAYANIDYLSRVLGESFVMTGAQLRVPDDPGTLRSIHAELKRMPGIQSVRSRRDMTRTLRATLLRHQRVFITLLVVFAGSMFFGGILNASYVSFHERRREVASLRALGYTPRELGGVFLREAFLVNVTGSLLGIPVAHGLVWLTAQTYDNEFLRLPIVTAPWIPVTTVAVGIVFTLLAHGLIHRSISDLPIREALNVRE